MSKRKGVSAEEKRNRLLELFYEKKDFFQLKELEKIAPREKGIVSQAVKEVLQSLVDDNLVETDKIGTSVYYWAFPGKVKSERDAKLESILLDIKNTSMKLKLIKERLAEEKVTEKEHEDHSTASQQLNALECKRNSLREEYRCFSYNTTEHIKTMERNNILIKDAVNRWTDNIYTVKSWAVNSMLMDANTFNERFQIPDLDYVDI